MGRFAADLLGGSDGETLRRKWDADVALLTRNAATLLVPPVAAGFSVLLARAGKVAGTAGFARALRRLPLLRAGLWACVVAAGLGLVANDSGVVVPAVMMLLAVPAGVLAATDGVLAAPDGAHARAGWPGRSRGRRDRRARARGAGPPSPTWSPWWCDSRGLDGTTPRRAAGRRRARAVTVKVREHAADRLGGRAWLSPTSPGTSSSPAGVASEPRQGPHGRQPRAPAQARAACG